MNIINFKVGDIITRNEPIKYGYEYNVAGDSSFCGDRLILKGHDIKSKIIFFEAPHLNIVDVSYARDRWDEGWCEYPETLWSRIKNKKEPFEIETFTRKDKVPVDLNLERKFKRFKESKKDTKTDHKQG